jgi:hypothetical protein
MTRHNSVYTGLLSTEAYQTALSDIYLSLWPDPSPLTARIFPDEFLVRVCSHSVSSHPCFPFTSQEELGAHFNKEHHEFIKAIC